MGPTKEGEGGSGPSVADPTEGSNRNSLTASLNRCINSVLGQNFHVFVSACEYESPDFQTFIASSIKVKATRIREWWMWKIIIITKRYQYYIIHHTISKGKMRLNQKLAIKIQIKGPKADVDEIFDEKKLSQFCKEIVIQ